MKSRVLCSAIAAIATFILSCGGGGETITGPQPAALEITTFLGAGNVLRTSTTPVVQLVDAAGAPFARAGVVVTASVISGDVKIMAGGTATTNGGGAAHFRDLLFGAKTAQGGQFELQYSAPGLSPVSEFDIVFCRSDVLTIGVTATGELQDGDCLDGGARFRYYDITSIPAQTALRVTQSAQFAPAVFVRTFSGEGSFIGVVGSTSGSESFKVLVPGQSALRFLASSAAPNTFGTFQLGASTVPQHEPGCDDVFFIAPVNSQQVLESNCMDDDGNVGDFFPFLLEGGASITATVASSAFVPYVSIWSNEPNVRLAYADGINGSASATYENTGADAAVLYVFAGSTTGTGTGSYTLQAGISASTQDRSARLVAASTPRAAALVRGRRSGGPPPRRRYSATGTVTIR